MLLLANRDLELSRVDRWSYTPLFMIYIWLCEREMFKVGNLLQNVVEAFLYIKFM